MKEQVLLRWSQPPNLTQHCQTFWSTPLGQPSLVNDPVMKYYLDKTLQLSTRVVIPPTHRKEVLLLFYAEHTGESKMQACMVAQDRSENIRYGDRIQNLPDDRMLATLASLQPWPWLRHNWQRVHLGFAHFEGKYFLLVVKSL